MLLMVATSRHHGMPALPGTQDWLQGALFNLWTPEAKHRHHPPTTTHLDPPPPSRPWPLLGISPAGRAQRGPSVVGGERGSWEDGIVGGGRCPCPLRRHPRRGPGLPPNLPLPLHLPPRSAPATDLAVMEVTVTWCSCLWGTRPRLRSSRGTRWMWSRRSTSPSPALPPRCGRPRCGTWATLPQRCGP